MIKGRGGALLREKIVACRLESPRHDDHRRQTGRAARHDRRRFPSRSARSALKHTERRLQQLRLLDDDPRAGRRLALLDRRRQPDHRLPVRPDRRSRNRSTVSSSASPACSRPGFFIDLCDTLIVGTDDRRRTDRIGDVRPCAPIGLKNAQAGVLSSSRISAVRERRSGRSRARRPRSSHRACGRHRPP